MVSPNLVFFFGVSPYLLKLPHVYTELRVCIYIYTHTYLYMYMYIYRHVGFHRANVGFNFPSDFRVQNGGGSLRDLVARWGALGLN